MKTMTCIAVMLLAIASAAAEDGSTAERAALRERLQAVRQENHAAREQLRQDGRDRVRVVLVDFPDILARIETRWRAADQRREQHQQQRQERRQERRQEQREQRGQRSQRGRRDDPSHDQGRGRQNRFGRHQER